MLLRTIPIAKPLCLLRCLTHYEVLSIPRTATKAEIKQAYLEKAKECHPDLNPDVDKAAVQFQELQDAHDTLMDSQQRAQYNQQINQESYFGSQQSPPTERRRSNVKSHGVKTQQSAKRNDKFHENHRVNQDNYQFPKSHKKYNIYPDQNDLNTEMSGQMAGGYMLTLAFLSVVLFGVVRIIFGIKEEFEEGRHGKLKYPEDFNDSKKSTTKSSSEYSGRDSKSNVEPRRYVYNAEQDATVRDLPKSPKTVIKRAGKPDQDIIRYVWNEEKGKLVRMYSLKGHGGGGPPVDLKDKFDASIQSQLGDISLAVHDEAASEEKKTQITLNEVRSLKRELSKKKLEYITAKTEYKEKLELYKEELRENREKLQEKAVS